MPVEKRVQSIMNCRVELYLRNPRVGVHVDRNGLPINFNRCPRDGDAYPFYISQA